jgi:thiosulfate/3-mercaptopyruvate sulfurtransferase
MVMSLVSSAALVFVPCATLGAQDLRAPVLVSTDWLVRRLADTSLVIIHTGPTRSDYDAGHVPGARFLSWEAYTTRRGNASIELPEAAALDAALEAIGVTDRSRIIVTGGPLVNTARLYYTLNFFGLGDRTSLLDGGIDAWREEGRPISTIERRVPRGNVTLSITPRFLVDAAWIVQNTSAPTSRIAVVDARTPEFFFGTAAGTYPRAGRLPMAGNLPHTWTTGSLTRLRDRMTLDRLLRRAGVAKGDTVVTYSHVGMQASVVFVAALLLGYEAAIYDGSFEDWSRRTDLPVSRGAAVTQRAIVR